VCVGCVCCVCVGGVCVFLGGVCVCVCVCVCPCLLGWIPPSSMFRNVWPIFTKHFCFIPLKPRINQMFNIIQGIMKKAKACRELHTEFETFFVSQYFLQKTTY